MRLLEPRAGDLSGRSGDHEGALRWWRLAAEQGDANSAGLLGEAALSAGDYAQARVSRSRGEDANESAASLVEKSCHAVTSFGSPTAW